MLCRTFAILQTTAKITLTILWANSADDKLMTFFSLFFFFQKTGFKFSDDLHGMSKPFFRGKVKTKYFNMPSAENFTQIAKR